MESSRAFRGLQLLGKEIFMRINSFKEIIKNYDYLCFDQWGVIHDGKKKFKYIDQTFKKLNKKCLILSNTSQTKKEAIKQTLNKLNINKKYFINIITCGEFFIDIKKNKDSKFYKIIKKKKCYVIKNDNDFSLLKKVNIRNVEYSSAKFILAMSIKPTLNIERFKPLLNKFLKKKIPMLCINPDKYVYDGKVRKFVYQVGKLAEYYEKKGGRVLYIGKPYKEIFAYAFSRIKIKKSKILMIGDSLNTDIAGANNFKIKSALVMDGFNKSEKKIFPRSSISKITKKLRIKPNYLIKNIAL